jgi:hypothetical protein
MTMTRIEAAKAYLRELVIAFEELEAERQRLLKAADRITEIQAEKADLVADAQDALAKFNSLAGTSYTLAQARNLFRPSPDTPQ